MPRLTRRVTRSYRSGVATSPRDNTPPHLQLRSTACFRPLSALILLSRYITYAVPFSYYTRPLILHCHRCSLPYSTVVPLCSRQYHLACPVPLCLSFAGGSIGTGTTSCPWEAIAATLKECALPLRRQKIESLQGPLVQIFLTQSHGLISQQGEAEHQF